MEIVQYGVEWKFVQFGVSGSIGEKFLFLRSVKRVFFLGNGSAVAALV